MNIISFICNKFTYVMIYEKDKLPKKHITRKLQRWVNMRSIFETVYLFDDYLKTGG